MSTDIKTHTPFSTTLSPKTRRNPAAASVQDRPAQPDQGVVGYVLKMYPRFSETFVVSEILAREAAGERLVIFSLRPPTDARFHPELAQVRAPVIQIPRPSSSSRLWQVLQRAGETSALRRGMSDALPELLQHSADDAAQAVALAQAAEAAGVTHLHAHFASVSTTVARLTAKITGLPYSFTAHAKDIFHEDVDEADLERKFADAHHAVTISEYNLKQLRQRFPEASSRLHLVRNGLNLERFPYQPRLQAEATPRILAVGRLVEKKGFALLVDAAAALRDIGLDVQVDIAGDGPLAQPLQDQINSLDLSDRVRLLGPQTQEEVRQLLASHDVFAAPFVVGSDGNADGLPTVLLEAMASGIRCVASDVTAVGEVIGTQAALSHAQTTGAENDDEPTMCTGWLVPSGDVKALTEALIQALQPGDHLEITGAARALVEHLFNSPAQAATLRGLVNQSSITATSDSCITAHIHPGADQ